MADAARRMRFRAMLPEARAHGIDFLPGTGCYFDGSGRSNIRLSFSFSDDEAIRRGVKILAGIIREYVPDKLRAGIA